MTIFNSVGRFALKHAEIAVGGVLLLSASHTAAHAYLDPGTGSIILQGLIAGIIGTAAFARMYWTKLKMLLRRPLDHDQDEGSGKIQ
jgi:hypothetical protein